MEPQSRADALERMEIDQAGGVLHAMHPKDRVATLAHVASDIREQALARLNEYDRRESALTLTLTPRS